MRYILILSLASMLIVIGSFQVAGEPVEFVNGLGERIDEIYIGERITYLRVRMPEDCINHELEMNSDLFEENFDGSSVENLKRNDSITMALHMEKDIDPGSYYVDVRLKYTTPDDIYHNEIFNVSLDFIQMISVKDIIIPHRMDETFILNIETFRYISSMNINLIGGGEVGVENRVIQIEDLEPGNHSFDTEIYRREDGFGSNSLGYRIESKADGKMMWFNEYEIAANVIWDDGDQADEDPTSSFQTGDNRRKIFPVVLIVLIVGMVFNYFYYINRMRLRGAEE